MKRILFVCVENSCRSQMAEGFAKKFGAGVIEAYSAGSKPSGMVNPKAVEVMKEKGIDISTHRSKGFGALSDIKFDLAITLGCNDTCPLVSSDAHLSWQIPDPKGKEMDSFRQTRDLIKDHVRRLVKAITETAAA